MTFSLADLPVLYACNGLQFEHMRVENLSQEDAVYTQNRIRILSGICGILCPTDATQPYCLEMQIRLPIGERRDPYAHWGDHLTHLFLQEEGKKPCIVNLASKKYSKTMYPYLCEESIYTMTFPVERAGRLKIESTQAKIARGAMINRVITQRIPTTEGLIAFHTDGYVCHKELFKAQRFVFMRRK